LCSVRPLVVYIRTRRVNTYRTPRKGAPHPAGTPSARQLDAPCAPLRQVSAAVLGMPTGSPQPMTVESCVRLLQEVPKLAVLLEPVRLIFCPNAKAGTTTVNTLLRTLLDSRSSGPQRQRPIIASSHVVRAGQRESLANHTEHGRMNVSRAQAFCRYTLAAPAFAAPRAELAVRPRRSGEVFSFTIARNPWSRVSHACHLLPLCTKCGCTHSLCLVVFAILRSSRRTWARWRTTITRKRHTTVSPGCEPGMDLAALHLYPSASLCVGSGVTKRTTTRTGDRTHGSARRAVTPTRLLLAPRRSKPTCAR
jgi:hypothetical protein